MAVPLAGADRGADELSTGLEAGPATALAAGPAALEATPGALLAADAPAEPALEGLVAAAVVVDEEPQADAVSAVTAASAMTRANGRRWNIGTPSVTIRCAGRNAQMDETRAYGIAGPSMVGQPGIQRQDALKSGMVIEPSGASGMPGL
jgi:hypothetical protein